MIKPVPLAMVLCDGIIIDKRTEKKSLIGIFSNMVAGKFPFRAQHFSIYIALTDGHGQYEGRLVCTDQNGVEIFAAKGPIEFRGGAKAVVEMVYDIAGLAFPSEGTYSFALLCGDEPVIARECRVSLMPVPAAPGPRSDTP
ncbi:MAG: hypothetical protein ABIF71_01300 [Planctomycetota bacterium]